jgi:uracil-DNA glycosylase
MLAGAGQAHGMAFSVQKGVAVPPSLKNIYQELASDLGSEWSAPQPMHGHLIRWAQQGVLLLNAVLTVRKANAASHQGKGWENFTDAAIKAINAKLSNVVFILWGGHAQKKESLISASKHQILKSAHPSPLSVTKFRGCKHFSKTNGILKAHGKVPIDWRVDGPLPSASDPNPQDPSETENDP